ncbi:MAG: sugar ABC transporter permease [Paracoccus sp. (in: a-proteobacteria)]|uniref:carbohydrate ABC transporter permease n=1 Tax=Paracoccus sp. TaxID=267 RepID=UPI0039E6C118
MTLTETKQGRPAAPRRDPRGLRAFRRFALLPAVIVLVLLTVVPVVNLMLMAMAEISFSRGSLNWSFAPMRNLAMLAGDRLFLTAIWNTLVFVVLSVSAEMALGIALAVLAASVRRGKGVIRTITILPILVSPVAIGAMWRLMYSYDFGLLNQILAGLGLSRVQWLSDTSIALLSVVVVDIWHWTPLVFLILFAAVEGLPRDVIEAARIDGATRWQLLRHVILPLLAPAIAVAFIFRAIAAFKVFDQIVLLTGGGPGTSTEVLSLRLYKVFFEQNNMGYGALLSVMTIAIILAFLLTAWTARRATEARHA